MSPHFFLTDNDEYHTLWNTGRYSRAEDAIDAVIICGSETCGAAGTICYGAPPGKIFTLCGDPGGEELEAELFRLLDAIFTQANRINL